MTLRVVARVRITLDIPCTQPWPEDVAFKHLAPQARENVVQALRNGLAIEGLKSAIVSNPTVAMIVGEPEVTAILVNEDGKL